MIASQVVLPTSRSAAIHEAHHAAALLVLGMPVPRCARIDLPRDGLMGSVTIDWGDGSFPESARKVLIAAVLAA